MPSKKKKKLASNPARGFATTSIASKAKLDAPEPEVEEIPAKELQETEGIRPEQLAATTAETGSAGLDHEKLTPEEFEKHLEESELQGLVEKHAQKSKRDALRQKTRLETDRRVLRGQAENLNTRKWLPVELMDEILDLVKTEGRFTPQSSESANLKQASEEDLIIRLWTLQRALVGAGFLEEKVHQALRHVLEISDKIGVGNKEMIWGMEDSLDWLSRECNRNELPDYENWQRRTGGVPKSQTGMNNPGKHPTFLLNLNARYTN